MADSLISAPPQHSSAATASNTNVLVIVAHPQLEQSRANRALMKAATAASVAHGGSGSIEIRNLYALYPDYLIDIATEQAALTRARLVVWQHPIQWYHMPPLMKLWVDEVLAFGWAYGPDGTALRGKDLWLVASTGGAEDSYRPQGYNRYFFDAFLPAYEQTAALCGMRFLPPLLLHGAHRASDATLREHAAIYVERLRRHPDWPEIATLPEYSTCDAVPLTARPLENFAESI